MERNGFTDDRNNETLGAGEEFDLDEDGSVMSSVVDRYVYMIGSIRAQKILTSVELTRFN